MVAPELRKPSKTAILTAAARELHRREPPPLVLDDTLALALAGDDAASMIELLERELPDDARAAFARWVCVRARLPEDVVSRAVEDRTSQYVILGAGLDSFAYRRLDLLDRLRVFEVDHPASQRLKLKYAGGLTPAAAAVEHVAADFLHDDIDALLAKAGHETKIATACST